METRSLRPGETSADALAELASHLTAEQLSVALAVSRVIADDNTRAWALAKLAGYLTGLARQKVLREALSACSQ